MEPALTNSIRERLLASPTIRERITKRAYELYLMRGAGHGGDTDDWLQAEQDILELAAVVIHESRVLVPQAKTSERIPRKKRAAEKIPVASRAVKPVVKRTTVETKQKPTKETTGVVSDKKPGKRKVSGAAPSFTPKPDLKSDI
ncbi:MAG: DUF2934 domain-containing protein [Acidobacteriota bacterium]